MPPTSVTAALIREKIGPQLGAVIGQTRISPSSTSSRSAALVMTRAEPSTAPGEAANPFNPPSPPPNQVLMLSLVMPHSMMVNGSVTTSGGTPSAGGGDHWRSALTMALRRLISRGQYLGPRAEVPTAQAEL